MSGRNEIVDSLMIDEDSPLLGKETRTSSTTSSFVRRVVTRNSVLKVAVACGLVVVVTTLVYFSGHQDRKPRIAFVGNSMQYYNDLPRLLEKLSEDGIEQNSCLHGGASLAEILISGNGMNNKFNTSNALLDSNFYGDPMYDFGACTVEQLLFGVDPALEVQVNWNKSGYLQDDGLNPCLHNGRYLDFLEYQRVTTLAKPPHWDYVFFNDFTVNPGRNDTRAEGLHMLETIYLPWLRRLDATPILLDTHAYWTPERNLSGLADSPEDIPHFTSLVYEGYRQYMQLLKDNLPASQQPRIAPVGLAFLLVWEENRELWHRMFHSDRIHASPTGTMLTACIVHHTLLGRLPRREVTLVDDLSSLWSRARIMQDPENPPNPFPAMDDATYLYDLCERVAVQGERPSTFIDYSSSDIPKSSGF